MYLFLSIGLYKVEHLENIEEDNEVKNKLEDKKLILSSYEKLKFYLLSETWIKYFCCCLSKKSKSILKVIKKSKVKVNEDFNLKIILKNIRELSYNVKRVIERNNYDEWKDIPNIYLGCDMCDKCKDFGYITGIGGI